jgi:hypothetical protein
LLHNKCSTSDRGLPQIRDVSGENQCEFIYKRVNFSVIAVTDIEQPVHLMPKFGSQMGRADKAKGAMDQAKENNRIWRQKTNYRGRRHGIRQILSCNITMSSGSMFG